ncbi:MAG: hypothetical protein R2686_07615 [Candidatus Nanopelagicales bacterium]
MRVEEYIGIYHAEGGLVGETKYFFGHLFGRVHCSLCDITHSPVRRKKQWDAFAASLGAPFRLYHLNDMPADVAGVVARVGSPVVMARTDTGLAVLVDAGRLERMDGSVEAFGVELARAAQAVG